jgi:hypothetical protein
VLGSSEGVYDYAAFDRAIAVLKSDPQVMIVGFSNDPLAARLSDIPRISPWTHFNSFTDRHADAAGNVEIAAGLLPYLRQLQARVCP